MARVRNLNNDIAGNLIAHAAIATPGNVRVFAYDYRNRLTSVKDYAGYVDESDPGTLVREATYSYDVYNRRISKTVDADGAGAAAAVPTWFVYDGANVVMQFNYERSMGQTFLHGPAVDCVGSAGIGIRSVRD